MVARHVGAPARRPGAPRHDAAGRPLLADRHGRHIAAAAATSPSSAKTYRSPHSWWRSTPQSFSGILPPPSPCPPALSVAAALSPSFSPSQLSCTLSGPWLPLAGQWPRTKRRSEARRMTFPAPGFTMTYGMMASGKLSFSISSPSTKVEPWSGTRKRPTGTRPSPVRLLRAGADVLAGDRHLEEPVADPIPEEEHPYERHHLRREKGLDGKAVEARHREQLACGEERGHVEGGDVHPPRIARGRGPQVSHVGVAEEEVGCALLQKQRHAMQLVAQSAAPSRQGMLRRGHAK